MDFWFSTSQLAGLPGMPSVQTHVNRKAKREKWQSRPRQQRGGGKEYHFDSLPPETQAHLKSLSEGNSIPLSESGAEVFGNFPSAPLSSQPSGDLVASPEADAPSETGVAASVSYSTDMGEEAGWVSSGVPHAPDQGVTGEQAAGSIPALPHLDLGLEGPEDPQERKAAAKYAILNGCEPWCQIQGLLKKVGCEIQYADAYNNQELGFPDWIYVEVPNLCRATLHNWRNVFKAKGYMALAGDYRGSTDTLIDKDPKISTYILGLISQNPHITPAQIWQGLLVDFKNIPISLYTVRRWVRRWKNNNRATYQLLKNPDGWKNKYMPAMGSYSEAVTAVNDLWELDSTPADVMLNIAGKPQRYSLVGCIDVYSRRAKLMVSRTSKAATIIALLRKCIIDWGLPKAIKTDNGKDYTAFHVKHTLAALEVEQKLCTPFSPEQKPHIERFFGTFARDLLELKPGYIGHSVAERKAIEAQKSFSQRFGNRDQVINLGMNPPEFQTFADQWCDAVYGMRSHGTTGMPPLARAAGASTTKLEDTQVLDLLMMPGGTRVVQKKGIRANNTWYISADLVDLIGETVHIRMPDDLGTLHVYSDERCSKFLATCEAPELTGVDRKVVAMEAKARVKKQRAAVSALKQVGKDFDAAGMTDRVMKNAIAGLSKVAAMPGRSVSADLPAAAAADEVLKRLGPKPAPTVSEADKAALAAEIAAEERKSDRPNKGRDPGLYAIWLIDHPEAQTSEDVAWLKNAQTIPAIWTVVEDCLELRANPMAL